MTGCSAVGSVHVWGAWGRRFKSAQPDIIRVANSDKAHLRQKVLKILKNFDEDTIQDKSESISRHLFSTSYWEKAKIVLAYITMKGEVDTAGIYTRALREGKRIAAPRITKQNLVFYCISSLKVGLKTNSYGIREPDPEKRALNQLFDYYENSDKPIIVVMPGLAFDRSLNRLGRGSGYYDRFLASIKGINEGACTFVGVCFREQLFDWIPSNQNDQRVDLIITEKEIIS